MKIIFFGTGSFGIPSLNALKNSSHELLAIISLADRPKGRHLKIQNNPVKDWALQNKFPCLEFLDGLKSFNADCFVVIAFGAILSKEILSLPRLAPLNVHASILPKYRGAAPIHWALMNGDQETGVSVIRMIEKVDAGDVLTQKKTAIEDSDDIFSLEKRLSDLGAQALMNALNQLEIDCASFVPQNESLVQMARKLKKEDGHIDWARSAQTLCNQIRALKKWPGSYTFFKGKRIIINDAKPVGEALNVKMSVPGSILSPSLLSGLCVSCADRAMEINILQLEGKKPLIAKEFLKGFALKEGDRLE